MVLLRHDFIVFGNPAIARLLGVADDNVLVGRHLAVFAPPKQPDGRASRVVADEHFATALREGHARFEWLARSTGPDADTWLEITLTPLSTEGGALVLATCRDLSARRRRAHLTLQATGRGLWTWDPVTDRLYLDERAQTALLGPDAQPPAPATLATLLDALHPDDRPRAERDITNALHTPETVELCWRAVWPDGSEHQIATLGHTVQDDPNGQPFCFNGLVREEQ